MSLAGVSKPSRPAPRTSVSPAGASRLFVGIGAAMAGIAVMAGAFGAHALRDLVAADRLQVFETGARYQMYHALALLVVGGAVARWPRWQVRWSGYLFIAGIVLFSGSLYVLVLTNTPWLGAVTPLGGVAFIAGWLLLAWGALARR